MPVSSRRFPDVRTLAAGLAPRLGGPVTVLRRKRNPNASTFPAEVVTCRLADGRTVPLLCKYGAGPGDDVYGHKAGVAYEADVYQEVLRPLRGRLAAPRCYGAHHDRATGMTCLVLEYLGGSARIHLTADPAAAMALAARWIGRFHALHEARGAGGRRRFLNAYDADYYRGWARRTAEFAGRLHRRFPWLAGLCHCFEELAGVLLDGPRTVIHGEYFPKNVLLHEGAIYPVDWESAALAAGEVDLASLTEGWPAGVARRCERAYRQARWPGGAPADFPERLAVARLYDLFRWLGDRPEWTTGLGSVCQFRQLHRVARRLGVI